MTIFICILFFIWVMVKHVVCLSIVVLGLFKTTCSLGTYREENGNHYRGTFKNGDFYGKGVWIETEEGATDGWPGQYKSENWLNGEIEGYGEYIGSGSKKGCSYKGEYVKTIENGSGTWIENDECSTEGWPGKYKSKNWLNGQITGYGEYVGSGSRKGCSYKGYYVNGIENGYGKWTDPDGTWWKGTFKNGEWISGSTNE
jgi:hypothetical protein